MIEVIYHRDIYRVTVKGHAHSAEKGKDLICAAVSTLVCTLAANVSNISEHLREPITIRLDDGDAEIHCTPVRAMRNTVKLVFDSVCVGFDLLARKYPEFISYVVMG